MDVENLPILQPQDFGSLVDNQYPILSLYWEATGPHSVAAHSHPRAQIIYPLSGAYWVNTPLGNWVVPRHQAVWIPSNIHHKVFTNASVIALMFFIDIAYASRLLQECTVVGVSPLLRQLFAKAVEYGNDYAPGGREARLVDVMLDELSEMVPAPLHLPLSNDKRLTRIMEFLLENPADDRTFEEIAVDSGASTRTLSRLFSKSTGMTFGEWRKQLRLLVAIDRLGQGHSVTWVALDLGYQSTSAFTAMFKRTLGAPPGSYLKD
jgi:AraC-like DNA-binding protein